MKCFQSRLGNGRFQRNTLANTFGLHALVCPSCRSFNTHGVGEPAPARCHSCGVALDIKVASEALPVS